MAFKIWDIKSISKVASHRFLGINTWNAPINLLGFQSGGRDCAQYFGLQQKMSCALSYQLGLVSRSKRHTYSLHNSRSFLKEHFETTEKHSQDLAEATSNPTTFSAFYWLA